MLGRNNIPTVVEGNMASVIRKEACRVLESRQKNNKGENVRKECLRYDIHLSF